MKEPSRRTSRQALALGLLAALALGCGGFLLGRTTSERPAPPVATPVVTPVPQPTAPIEVTKRTFGRADLIALASGAADAFAAGRPMPSDVLAADGRLFELRLPFGCNGPATADSDATARWRYDEQAKALRVHVAPTEWVAADWLSTPSPAVEGIEGFWITRPWTSSEACPVDASHPPTGTQPVTLPGQTLAIAQIFTSEDTRQGRRDGTPFETVKKIAPDALDTSQGFQLRLRGRIARVPGGGPILCRQPAGPEQRPICLLAAALDDVAIINPATDDVLATWPMQRSSTAKP